MDVKDFLILSELMKNPFSFYEDIGSGVGLSGVSVGQRIHKMESSGFLQGIYLIPSPITLGRKAKSYVFTKVRNAKSKLEKVIDIECVVFAWIDHEDDVIVSLYYESEMEIQESLAMLSSLLGGGYTSVFTPLSLLPPILRLSRYSSIDWKILLHMISNPRVSVSEISGRTKLSRKTVLRHRSLMAAGGNLFPVFLMDFNAAKGAIFYGIIAFFENMVAMNSLKEMNLLPVWMMNNPSGAYMLGMALSLTEVEDIKSKMAKLKGISGYSLSIPAGGVFSTERVKGWIQDHIDLWRAASFSH